MRSLSCHLVSALLLISAGIVCLGGCQQAAWRDASWCKPGEKGEAGQGREQAQLPTRSHVFDNPRLARLSRAEMAMYGPGELPWYCARRDYLPATYDGIESPTYEQSVTLTYDQQYQAGRHVYDYINSTTYRSSIVQQVR